MTELTARPLLNALWPELAGFVQPLGGEYAGRRSALEQVPFVSGYGVEVGLLIDLLELGAACRRWPRSTSACGGTPRSRRRRSGRWPGRSSRRCWPAPAAGGPPAACSPSSATTAPGSCRAAARSPSTSGRRWPRSPSTARCRPRASSVEIRGGACRCRSDAPDGTNPRRASTDPAALTGPEVVAHRGATAEAPEHTLAAYRHAAAIGATASRCDVRLTRDGVLVCVHDRQVRQHLQRPGRGVGAAPRRARAVPLRRAPAQGADRAPRGPMTRSPSVTDEPDVEDGLVLTLDRLLDYATASPGRVRLAIETKHPTRHTRKVEEALVDALRRFGLLGNGRPVEWAGRPAVRVMSFSQLAVRRMHELAPGVPDRPADRQAPAPGASGAAARRRRHRRRPRHRAAAGSTPTTSPTRTPRARRCTSGR